MTGKEVRAVIISRPEETHSAIKKLLERRHTPPEVFGLDIEWNAVSRRGQEEIPALLQVARPEGFCALFRLNFLKRIPAPLKDILENPKYIKVGVETRNDAIKLQKHFQVDTKGVLDIRFLAREKGVKPKGLAYLTETVLGFKLKKMHYSQHHWTGELSERKKMYAALDAVSGVRIFQKLNHEIIKTKWGDKSVKWKPQYYHDITVKLWKKFFGKHFYLQQAEKYF